MLIIKSVFCIFADIIYLLCGTSLKAVIDMDVARNLKWDRNRDKIKGRIMRLNHLLLTKKEFRSIFYYRAKQYKYLASISKIFLPCPRAIEFGGEIGGGLMVSHFHSIICPAKAGKNFRVGPGAVIDAPTFGDNVYVASNSTVIGDLHIGNNVIIGAGSVVTEDLQDNGVYVGNPAKLIKQIGEDESLLNEIM